MSFDFDRREPCLKNENVPWIEQARRENGDDTPLQLFLAIPGYSPRNSYMLGCFKSIDLDTALEKILDDDFESSQSELWLHDGDGHRCRAYNGVMPVRAAHQKLQLKYLDVRALPALRPLQNPCASLTSAFVPSHIHHPTTESMGLLILNTGGLGRDELGGFLFKYIKAHSMPASIGFNVGTGGRTFSFTFHLPSFVLKRQKAREDPRKKGNGRPWRESRPLSFLSKPIEIESESASVDTLHEAHYSLMICGYNRSVWTTYSLVDTYFYDSEDHEDTVESYRTHEDSEVSEWDPALIGGKEVWTKCPDPREYFLMILDKRFTQIYEELFEIIDFVQDKMSDYLNENRTTHNCATVSRDSAQKLFESAENKRMWLRQTEQLLDLLSDGLSSILRCWKAFEIEKENFAYNRPSATLFDEIQRRTIEMNRLLDSVSKAKSKCDGFRKDLELANGVQGGPGSVLQYLKLTFIQVMTPVVVSASIIQADILTFGPVFLRFVMITAVLFGICWFIEPGQNPIPGWTATITKRLNTRADDQNDGRLINQHLRRGWGWNQAMMASIWQLAQPGRRLLREVAWASGANSAFEEDVELGNLQI
ncbi:Arginine-tRNA ligase cytoplasmic [Fusarium mundagurra]|uniref:Arginine-tRNA ligase cytoplasmic n=1 Tax=Fusarium mundagurra TaxID=1567541 RepID=A0A8H5XM52_9HYPO|nr:Arginine-tRNA ligase cytoplasmic [Fusarium mundagurra]